MATITTSTTTSSALTILKGEIELKVPLSIGTLQWGTTWIDGKIINKFVLEDLTCEEILNIVSDAGVTLIDTAEGYGGGTSEKRLGRIITKDEKDKTKKDGVVFMTKFLPAPWRAFHSDFERAARASCKRLGVDCIPVYLLHSPVHWRPIEYWIEAAAICRKKGLIQSMGLSNCNADQVERAVAAGKKYGVQIVCNQVHYSLLDYNSIQLQEMQAVCEKHNVRVIGFAPIGQGLLTESFTDESWKASKARRMMRLQLDEIHALRSVISEMAIKYGKSMTQICLNWSIQHNVIPLVGCRSVKHAKDSVGCLGWSLSPEDTKKLDQAALSRSTFDGKTWVRMLFVTLFGVVMVTCRTLDTIGFGSVVPIKKRN